MALLCAAFAALGTWQVHRRTWKLDLIARVDERVGAAASDAPARSEWPRLDPARDEYRHVRLVGTFDHTRETLVTASTELGYGFWVVTPLRTGDGSVVLVNRGFVPPELRDPSRRREGQMAGQVSVTGLLRLSEPGGAFLRRNDPGGHRWYSRDVAAIASARDLGETAPFFVDADRTRNPGSNPVGGLTVIDFPNNHLVYALTWYGLAAMSAGALGWLLRENLRGPEGTPLGPDRTD